MSVIAKGRHSEEIQRGVTKNVGLNAKVQWIAGIYPWLDSLVSYLFEKKASNGMPAETQTIQLPSL